MEVADFTYSLSEELIAQRPLPKRTASRLMILDGNSGAVAEAEFASLPELLSPGDLLVFNDTRVVRARLSARKSTGGRAEVLVERVLDDGRALAQVRASKPLRPPAVLHLEGPSHSRATVEVKVAARIGEFFELQFPPSEPVADLLARMGTVPLPPYIRRGPEPEDEERYQTVYGCRPGAVAAPTAGLHFDREWLERIRARGVEQAFVTLHVGAGTFLPVRAERVEEHRMHPEVLEVSRETCERVAAAKARGKRVIAVGTTVVRALESCSRHGRPQAFRGETRLFIYPGYRFQCIDAMVTNFHLPGSTLLMLVCAFAGREHVLNAYRHAVQKRFRFFSYGDAMLVTRRAV